jgi:hypothetical protein
MSRFAWAQAYPARPVRIIVGAAPSGTYDIMARLIGEWLSERLGHPFVIENRPGAGTTIGTEAVVKAPPDGYTLLLVGAAAVTSALVYNKLNFNLIRDIAPVAAISREPHIMVVNPSVQLARFPSSSPTPKVIRARSAWLRAAHLPYSPRPMPVRLPDHKRRWLQLVRSWQNPAMGRPWRGFCARYAEEAPIRATTVS